MPRIRLAPNIPLESQIAGIRKAIATLERGVGPVWLLDSHKKRLRALLFEQRRRKERARKKAEAREPVKQQAESFLAKVVG